jgi:phosphatidate cytidylyltransferase
LRSDQPELEPEAGLAASRPREPDPAGPGGEPDAAGPGGAPDAVPPPAPRAGRNLKVAAATGTALAALVVGLLFVSAGAFFALAALIILVGQAEFYLAARRAGRDPALPLGLVAGAALLTGVFLRGEGAVGLILFLTFLFTFVWYLVSERSAAAPMSEIAVTVLGVAYIPLLGSFAGLLARRPDGRGVIIAMILATAVYDMGAYAGGSRFGRHRLAPTISPNKTTEGAMVATFATLLIGTAGAHWLGPWSWGQAALFALLVCVAAPIGDLVESMIKRDFGIKDMGTILPGHGGALDRIDAMLFTGPAAYLSLRAFGI